MQTSRDELKSEGPFRMWKRPFTFLAKGRWGRKNIKRPPGTDGLLQLVVVYKITRQQVISICCMGKKFFLAYNPFIFAKNQKGGIVAIMGKKTLVLGASPT
jgi:hypothetical protein